MMAITTNSSISVKALALISVDTFGIRALSRRRSRL